jgi:sodium-coupled neutral amino acid transporter 9
LAFMIHNAVAGIMKNNRDSSKNTRDLGIAYSLVWVLYVILGVMGSLAVAGLFNGVYYENKGKCPDTIMKLLVRTNLYLSVTQQVFATISLSFIFIQLTTVIPILCFFTRRQFFDLIYGPKKRIPPLHFHSFNFIYTVCCLVIELLGWNINKIVGLTGAVGGFLLIYVIPVWVHVKCLYIKNNTPDATTGKTPLIYQANYDKDDKELEAGQKEKEQAKIRASEKCRHGDELAWKNPMLAYVLYSLLVLFGLSIMVVQLYDILRPKPES